MDHNDQTYRIEKASYGWVRELHGTRVSPWIPVDENAESMEPIHMNDRDALSVIVSHILGASAPAETRIHGAGTVMYNMIRAHIEWFLRFEDGIMSCIWKIESHSAPETLDSIVDMLLEHFKGQRTTTHTTFTRNMTPDSHCIRMMLNCVLEHRHERGLFVSPDQP